MTVDWPSRVRAWMCRHNMHAMVVTERGVADFYVRNGEVFRVEQGEPVPAGARYAGNVPWARGYCRRCQTPLHDEDWGSR